MEPKNDIKTKQIVRDALGRVISRDQDRVYFVSFDGDANNVSKFFKNAEDQIKKTGFIKLYKENPRSKNIVKVRIKPQAKIACISIQKHFSLLKQVLTSNPDDNLVNHEWKTILYLGFSGVFNPSENFIRINDLNNISFVGAELNV
jgi:hypothetical protein